MNDFSGLHDDELYERMMQSAGPVMPCGAAVRLVFRVPALRAWLMANGFTEAASVTGRPAVVVRFAEAFDVVRKMYGRGMLREEHGIGDSEISVLWIAASLWGVGVGTLRHVMTDLEQDHAGLVAEAMMYAAGFMDSSAHPGSGDVDGPFTGPLHTAYEARW